MLKGIKGDVYTLPAQSAHKGGEGSIYILPNKKVVKVYSPKILKTNVELESKLKFMVDHPPQGDVVKYMAWPIDLLYDNGKFCGFVMNNLQGYKEIKGIHTLTKKDMEPMVIKLQAALNLSMMVSLMHKSGYVIGDFNPKNSGYNDKGNVCFFDNDSFQFTDEKGHKFKCVVQMEGYVAPEVLLETDAVTRKWVSMGKNGIVGMADLDTGFTQETDLFALATHIFQLMMNGTMPYNTVPASGTQSTSAPVQAPTQSSSTVAPKGNDDVKNDRYCFRAGYKPFSLMTPRKESFPPYIMDLFDKAFRKLGPGEHRPTGEDWKKALDKYSSDVVKCKVDQRHIYWKQAQTCPYCEASGHASANMTNPKSSSFGIRSGTNIQSTGKFGSVPTGYRSGSTTTSTSSGYQYTPPVHYSDPRKRKVVLIALVAYLAFAIYAAYSAYSYDVSIGDSQAFVDLLIGIIPPIVAIIGTYFFKIPYVGIGLGVLGIAILAFGIISMDSVEYWAMLFSAAFTVPVSILQWAL